MGPSCPQITMGMSSKQRRRLKKYFDMDVFGIFNVLLGDTDIPDPVVGTLGQFHGNVVVGGDKATGPGNKEFPGPIGDRQGNEDPDLLPGLIKTGIVYQDKTSTCGIGSKGQSD